MNSFIEVAVVLTNDEIAHQIYRIKFESPRIAETVVPGQFVNLEIDPAWIPLFRRPMSVAGAEDGTFALVYKVMGHSTRTMTTWSAGQHVSILGPLGNGWTIAESVYPVLMGGGVGLAPILFLHALLNRRQIDHQLIIGARTAAEHFLAHDPGAGIILTTDDGSTGMTGNVISGLTGILPEMADRNPEIFGCGPVGMLKGLQQFAQGHDLQCQLAVEEIMACGVGICQGCSVDIHDPQDKNLVDRRLVCRDGPVFSAQELVLDNG